MLEKCTCVDKYVCKIHFDNNKKKHSIKIFHGFNCQSFNRKLLIPVILQSINIVVTVRTIIILNITQKQ